MEIMVFTSSRVAGTYVGALVAVRDRVTIGK